MTRIRLDCLGRWISPSQTPLLDNTRHSQEADFYYPGGGIRTCSPFKEATADQRLRPCGDLDWRSPCEIFHKPSSNLSSFVYYGSGNEETRYLKNYNWINQLSNTTVWWLDIYVVYYIGINYMFRLLWPSSG